MAEFDRNVSAVLRPRDMSDAEYGRWVDGLFRALDQLAGSARRDAVDAARLAAAPAKRVAS